MANYVWQKFYPKGIPHNIDPDKYSSLVEVFEESFKKYSNQVAYISMGKSMTFSELDRLSSDFGAWLQHKANLKKGDRIAIQMPNLLQYPVALLGALRAGLIVVNTNPLYKAREMEHQFIDSQVKAIVILANFAHNLEKIITHTQIEKVIVTEIGDMLGGLKGTIINMVVKHVKKMVPDFHISGTIKFNQVLAEGKNLQLQTPNINNNDIAFLQYTGGTTGVSKGAMLTHRNMIANLEQMLAWMKPKLKESQEFMVTALPLYHIFALTVNCLAMLTLGAKNLLITNPRDMKAFIKDLKKYPFTVITGVNTLFNGLLNQEKFKEINFKHLKIGVGGGMAVQKAVAKKWQKVTGTALVEGYGLTETSPVLTCNPIDGTERIGTIGLPLPNTEIKIVNEEGQEVGLDEPGEILARGPQVMPGYWKMDDETKNVFTDDGWLRTGDIATINEDGFITIVDRKKEMINVSGFNVYPNEIEEIISSYSKVLEVGVIGVPDAKSNEVVMAFVVKKDESLSEEEIHEYCKENLTGYKRPKYIVFRKELPKSNVGKILRRLLKEEMPAQSELAEK